MVKATLPGVALALATLTGAALATAPYDFAGHWTGNAQETGKSAVMLTADFTMAGARTFSGTLAVADGDQPMQCTVNAKVRRRVNVALRGACADGGTLRLRGRVNPDKQTIAGTFAEKRSAMPSCGCTRMMSTFGCDLAPKSACGSARNCTAISVARLGMRFPERM